MKKILSVLLVFAALFMVSCSNDSKKDEIDVEGTWIYHDEDSDIDLTKIVIRGSVATSYQFDGEAWDENPEKTTVEVSGTTITFIESDGSEYSGELASDGKSFTVDIGDGTIWKYVKQ